MDFTIIINLFVVLGAMLTQFQREALGDVINEDALWIMAAGLGCDQVMMSFLEIHCVPESLVLVINTSSNQVGVQYLHHAAHTHAIPSRSFVRWRRRKRLSTNFVSRRFLTSR